jgi:phosphatidylinositol-3-phosphatase
MRAVMRTPILFTILLVACHGGGGSNGDDGDDSPIDASRGGDGDIDAPPGAKVIHTIFVIPMENKDQTQVIGSSDAPYINGLLAATAAHATKFGDALPSSPSEPHYLWMEGGTNAYSDRTFTNDDDPSATNSTASTGHIATQLTAAGIPWMSYQEGITTNTCPIKTAGHYAPKHNPFVFFKDVAGSPPSATTPGCMAHHKSYADFAGDLAGGLTGYVYITPDICHDMHGATDCPSGIFDGPNIKAGDDWLKAELPRIIDYTKAHDDAVIFLVWDEGTALFSSNVIPFLAIGNLVKGGYTSSVTYTHSSLVKSIEKLLGVPVLPTVAAANDFADMFQPDVFH